MDGEEDRNDMEDSSAAKKAKRIRNTVKSASICSMGLGKDDLSSFSDDSEYEYSEDEWSAASEKKKTNKRTKKVAPKQMLTLKLKLREQTRKLRQMSKQSSPQILKDQCKAKVENGHEILTNDDYETPTSTETKLKPSENNRAETLEDWKPPLDVIEYGSFNRIENIGNRSSTANTAIKEEATVASEPELSAFTKNQSDQEPIVINYSIDRSQVTKTFLPSGSPSTLSSNPSFADTIRFKSSMDSVFAIDVRSNSGVGNSLWTSRSDPVNVGNTKIGRVHKSEKNGALSLRTCNVGSQRVLSNARPNSFRIVKSCTNNYTPASRIKKADVSNQRRSSSDVDKIITRNDFESSVVRNSSLPAANTPNRVLTKFNDISPSGTVIHTGTGSITITPRRTVSEKPPIQRKLFKNEIEGMIAVRGTGTTFQYVVNLANGTYIPLSDLQVKKLREQHKGALPIKLKIPVPCDVADKIEPSFLIED